MIFNDVEEMSLSNIIGKNGTASEAHMGLLCGYNIPCQYDLELIQPTTDILP